MKTLFCGAFSSSVLFKRELERCRSLDGDETEEEDEEE